MATYSIKKTNNGEYKEIEKTFVLDTSKFRGKSDILYFNVEGEENPAIFDLDVFESIMMSQIDQGFMESLEYKDGLLIATTRDGNTIKKYTYDFGWNRLKDGSLEDESRKKDNNTKIVEKHFVLDVDKFRGRSDTLYFYVLGEKSPSVFDLGTFVSSFIGQIDQGMVESLECKDDLLIAITREGNTIKKYTYDLGFSRLKDISKEPRKKDGTIKEIEKHFVLDIDKYRGHGDTLSFNVEGEENPTVFDFGVFVNNLIGQIEQGLIDYLEFKDDLLITIINDGKTIKKYTYDLGFSRLKDSSFGMGASNSFDELKSYILKIVSYYNENLNNSLDELKDLIYKIVSYYRENPNNSLDELKDLMYKIVSYYNENPNREIMSKQKYIRMILDIMDGDRLPRLESNDEILRVFQVYHANKAEILDILLDNVVFYDDNGNVLDYSPFIKTRKLEAIKYEILNQMEIKMLMFAVANNAYDLYQEYNSKTNIMPVEIQYKYVDEEGNEVEPEVEEVEAGTIFSVGREIVGKGLSDLRDIVGAGAGFASSVASNVLKKVKEHKRTK